MKFMETLEVTAAVDFEQIVLKKGERAPKGWKVVTLTADAFPKGWPPNKPQVCACGCGKTHRIGDRVAVRNVKRTGGYFVRPR